MTVFTVFGGHGKVSLLFTKIASEAGHVVYSVVRDYTQNEDIEKVNGRTKVCSLEKASPLEIADLLKETRPDTVIFAAGSGGKGGVERTKAVDYEGAVKVFDAMKIAKIRRLIMLSAIDNRDMTQPPPTHYTAADIDLSQKIHKSIGAYYYYKFLADQELVRRSNDIDWTIVRPSGLTDEDSDGKIAIGKISINCMISRETVARAILLFAMDPQSNHLIADITDGEVPIHTAISGFIVKGESSYTYSV
ncbi:fungal protein [Schizosaccharomyces cryophilus OY26]|uniref:Fungal protein n=1 Tax=Schizosaccharomyces cryophilus (strain OY26 / ATCC MYA-4695 / CBS 11777 / NBRC 106824 / NRRL Y48691) TaxID=653667 RepID=S9W8R5_SCHCR|nr:uncharacterized protein SPOG_04177 [Schizosaccharomyces cryophilus OY26]EPY54285.1 fungal protein [Schizosaccharomyces cryophilus OY26]